MGKMVQRKNIIQNRSVCSMLLVVENERQNSFNCVGNSRKSVYAAQKRFQRGHRRGGRHRRRIRWSSGAFLTQRKCRRGRGFNTQSERSFCRGNGGAVRGFVADDLHRRRNRRRFRVLIAVTRGVRRSRRHQPGGSRCHQSRLST